MTDKKKTPPIKSTKKTPPIKRTLVANCTKKQVCKTLSDGDQLLKDLPQLDLFEILASQQNSEDYSHTIDAYDVLPKYSWDQQRAYTDLTNAYITRRCVVNKEEITVTVKPAIIVRPDGTSVLIYPGQREEIIEDVLRKFACNGLGALINEKLGVSFTLYELRQELSNVGHTYSLNEIKEALQVCRGATLECVNSNGSSIGSSFFPLVGLTTQGDLSKKKGNHRCYVQFNPMVNASVVSLSFRQINYKISMAIKSPLARHIYKRMVNFWTYADEVRSYGFSLVSYLGQTSRPLSSRMSENVRAMKNALDILTQHGVIKCYEATPKKKGNFNIDVRYEVYAHPNFVRDVIVANVRSLEVEQRALRIVKPGAIHHDITEDS